MTQQQSNLLWLAIRTIKDKHTHEHTKQAGQPKQHHTAPGKPIESPTNQSRQAALNELTLIYPDRINPHL